MVIQTVSSKTATKEEKSNKNNAENRLPIQGK
jgi:hypothetical protein